MGPQTPSLSVGVRLGAAAVLPAGVRMAAAAVLDRNTDLLAVVVDQQAHPRARLVRDYPAPAPADGETTVRVVLAGICSTDLEIVRGYMGFSGVLGHEFVGIVEDPDSPLNGRRVVCEINCVCGSCDMCGAKMPRHCRNRTVVGILGRDGCFAERICVPAQNLRVVPDAISDRAAVFVEPLAAAVHVLDELGLGTVDSGGAAGRVDARTRVAVIGTGRLGLLVAQVLAFQPCRLTAFGRNAATLEFCRARGIEAVDVGDPAGGADWKSAVQLTDWKSAPQQEEFDAVVECSGSASGLRLAMGLVRPRGTIVLKSTYAIPGDMNLAPIVIDEIRVVGSRCGDFAPAISLLERREIDVEAMIRREFALAEAEAALVAAGEPGQLKVLMHTGEP